MGDDRYAVEMNKGDLSMHWMRDTLNDRARDGWSFVQAYEQNGNTILIFERAGNSR
jgi:hypothetical protein